jgi:hypothetical protein
VLLFGEFLPGHFLNTARAQDHESFGAGGFTGSGSTALTPDGTVLTVPADSVAWGHQIDHHNEAEGTPWMDHPGCFVTGTALLSRVTID